MNNHDPIVKEFVFGSKQVLISPDLVHQELDGEIVILNMRSGQYFGIDQVGSRIWGMLEKKVDLSDMIDQLLSEYDVEADICRHQVAAFLDALEENGLVSVKDAP